MIFLRIMLCTLYSVENPHFFQEFERSRAFLFLNEIKRRFQAAYGSIADSAIAYSMNVEFGRVLANEMKHYSESHDVDTISRVHGELDELKDIMVKNIGKIIAEKLFLYWIICFYLRIHL